MLSGRRSSSGQSGDFHPEGRTMKLLVALSCLIVAVAAKPLLGTEQCANGPGVWCVDVRSASQCGAVKHCQQTVWNKPVVKSVPCDVCKEMMTFVDNFLKDNGTRSEILAYVNKVCELIPDPSLASQCKELVGEYYPIILDIILEELGNPSVVCCALHLCSSLQQHLAGLKPQPQQILSNEIPDMDMSKIVYPYMANLPLLFPPQDKPHEESKDIDVCQDCLHLFNDVQELLKINSSFSKSLIANALKQCDQLGGGMSDACKAYVNQYGDLALQMVIQVPAQQICSSAGLCTQEKSTPMVVTPAKVIVPAMKLQPAIKVAQKPEGFIDPVCDVCQMVVTKLESLLKKNSTQEEIKEILDKVCDYLPSHYHDQCRSIIDTYCEAIIELLEQEITPKQICMVLGMCSAQQPKIVKLTPERIQSGACCHLCKTVVSYIDEILQKNVTQERIENALKIVCNFLSGAERDECYALVHQYEPLFIELLLQAMDPTYVCQKMSLCPTAPKPLLGSEKCMWGPSYWCKDMETAGSCNAIEHCKRHVWN